MNSSRWGHTIVFKTFSKTMGGISPFLFQNYYFMHLLVIPFSLQVSLR